MKIIISLLFLILSTISFAQIGINTDEPQQLVHIDALHDTQVHPTPVNYYDDVVVTSSGKIGLGTLSPDARLHINTAGTPTTPVIGLRLQDGSEANGYGWTSDNDGYGQWKVISPEGSRKGIRQNGITLNLLSVKNKFINTNTYIDLPTGRWLLNLTILCPATVLPIGTTYKIQITVGDGVTSGGSNPTNTSDLEGNTTLTCVAWPATHAMIKNILIINNTTTATKRYYLLAGKTDSTLNINIQKFGGGWGEDVITAFQLQD